MENRGLLLRSAMFHGLFLGVFWVVKYLFFVWGVTNPSVNIVYWALTPLTIVFAYVFTNVYRLMAGKRISFFQAWQYGVLLYFFAALIVSLLHYVFYAYLAPAGYLDNVADMAMSIVRELTPQAEDAMLKMPYLTPIRMAIQGIFTNVFYGILFSLPVAALLCGKKL
ncbi:MAG: DUF4199 domain-containing protein [Tannerellaceae bacterium]|jgi:hypothetical protein|nr:DUF4199 domain-containing protein [Tannerellaceae bacterium]